MLASTETDDGVEKFVRNVTRWKRKSLLLAVYRDSAAEGMDFPAECTRMMFLTGVPYPNITDPWISAKKDFEFVSGNTDWYQGLTAMAVRQVVSPFPT